MWLLNKQTPDFRTISDFRKDNKKAISEAKVYQKKRYDPLLQQACM